MSEVGDDIIEGLKNALAYVRGNTAGSRTHIVEVPVVDVRALRKKLGLSQDDFALLLRVSPGMLRSWERGRCCPLGPVQALLRVIDREPEAAMRALAEGNGAQAAPPLPVAEPSAGGGGAEQSGRRGERARAARGR